MKEKFFDNKKKNKQVHAIFHCASFKKALKFRGFVYGRVYDKLNCCKLQEL